MEAADIGRELVGAGVFPEQVAEMHEQALSGLTQERGFNHWPIDAIRRSVGPLTEVLMAYGMVMRLHGQQRERMTAELRALSLHDELTGLHSRRAFLTLAQKQLELADRQRQPLLLLLADVDRMTWSSGAAGRRPADRALIDTASALRNTFRRSDVMGRVGADEFAVLAVGADLAQAADLSGRFLATLQACRGRLAGRPNLFVSIGVARFDPEAPRPLEVLLAEADRLACENKRRACKA